MEFCSPLEWSQQTWLLLLGWTIMNVGPMWYTIYSNKKSKPDPVRDRGYESFVRIDYDDWSYTMAFFTHFFFLPRFILGWSLFFTGCLVCAVMCIGSDPFNLPMWRIKTI